MKIVVVAAAALCLVLSACSQMERTTNMANPDSLPVASTLEDMRTVSPALERYSTGVLLGDVWKRPQLSARDRSIVTLPVLISRNQTVEMPYYLNLALDSGLKPSEISEIMTHLAFYSGWGNAASAVVAAKAVFEKRGIKPDQLPSASGALLPVDEVAEAQR